MDNSSAKKTLSTPDLCDEFPSDVRICQEDWRHFGGIHKFYGEIVTVKCFEDNSFVKKCLNEPGCGKVLVVDGGASRNRALLGDQIAKAAFDNGWHGIIIRGAVRDVEILRQIPIGILALSSCPLKTDRQDQGLTAVPLIMGGIRLQQSEWVFADLNGMVVADNALI